MALVLATYPDVRAAVSAGHIDDVERHWFELGRHEVMAGARAVAREYDKYKCLALRPDVASAVAAGAFVNGYDHCLRCRRTEMEQVGEL